MELALAVLIGLAMALLGLILHRVVARWVLENGTLADDSLSASKERERLLSGFLPGLVLVGLIGVALAVFRLLRPDILAAIALAILILCRRDAAATIKAVNDLFRDIAKSIRAGNFTALFAVIASVAFLGALLLRTEIPSESPDIAAFQLPLARSMIAHQGFVYPQIDNIFYSYNPLFFNLLFAEAMMYLDREVAASVVNVVVFLGFLSLLTTFFDRARSAGLLLILLVIGGSSYFTYMAAIPLLDLMRAAFAAGAMLFGYRYLERSRRYDAAMAGLLAGAAAAGHYLELLAAAILALSSAPQLLRGGRRVWVDAAGFAIAFLLVAGFWYLRNWLLTGNPIYPLIFGHPGISDSTMARFMTESAAPGSGHALAALLTMWPGAASIGLLLLGLIFGKTRPWMLIAATLLSFLVWRFVLVNPRWAMDFMLLLCATAIVASVPLIERAETAFIGARAGLVWLSLAVAMGAAASLQIAGYGTHLVPSWVDLKLMRYLVAGRSVDSYLADTMPGFAIYRYIGERDLRPVLQLVDKDGSSRAAAFNEGRDGNWLITDLPSSGGAFVAWWQAHGNLRYFIAQDESAPAFAKPSMPPEEAQAINGRLKREAKPLLSDRFGWTLYTIDDAIARRAKP